MLKNLTLILLCGILTACSTWNSSDSQSARCREIKHRMIFSGATNNQIVAAQESAKMGNLNRGYREEGCS